MAKIQKQNKNYKTNYRVDHSSLPLFVFSYFSSEEPGFQHILSTSLYVQFQHIFIVISDLIGYNHCGNNFIH